MIFVEFFDNETDKRLFYDNIEDQNYSLLQVLFITGEWYVIKEIRAFSRENKIHICVQKITR